MCANEHLGAVLPPPPSEFAKQNSDSDDSDDSDDDSDDDDDPKCCRLARRSVCFWCARRSRCDEEGGIRRTKNKPLQKNIRI